MLQQELPDDYVIASGVSHSVRDLIEIAFARAELDWRKYVTVDPKLLRPAEVDHLLGDATKARKQLGWTPTVGTREGLLRTFSMADVVKTPDLRLVDTANLRIPPE